MDNEIEQLIENFAKDIPNRAAQLQAAVNVAIAALKSTGSPDWRDVEHLSHKLAGSTGTYGFLQLSAVCRYLEDLICDKPNLTAPATALSSHLERWTVVFTEQWELAARRARAAETPDQLTEALKTHWLAALQSAKAAA